MIEFLFEKLNNSYVRIKSSFWMISKYVLVKALFIFCFLMIINISNSQVVSLTNYGCISSQGFIIYSGIAANSSDTQYVTNMYPLPDRFSPFIEHRKFYSKHKKELIRIYGNYAHYPSYSNGKMNQSSMSASDWLKFLITADQMELDWICRSNLYITMSSGQFYFHQSPANNILNYEAVPLLFDSIAKGCTAIPEDFMPKLYDSINPLDNKFYCFVLHNPSNSDIYIDSCYGFNSSFNCYIEELYAEYNQKANKILLRKGRSMLLFFKKEELEHVRHKEITILTRNHKKPILVKIP